MLAAKKKVTELTAAKILVHGSSLKVGCNTPTKKEEEEEIYICSSRLGLIKMDHHHSGNGRKSGMHMLGHCILWHFWSLSAL
jgi:hypothetical protein